MKRPLCYLSTLSQVALSRPAPQLIRSLPAVRSNSAPPCGLSTLTPRTVAAEFLPRVRNLPRAGPSPSKSPAAMTALPRMWTRGLPWANPWADRPELAQTKPNADRTSSARLVEIRLASRCFSIFGLKSNPLSAGAAQASATRKYSYNWCCACRRRLWAALRRADAWPWRTLHLFSQNT